MATIAQWNTLSDVIKQIAKTFIGSSISIKLTLRQ